MKTVVALLNLLLLCLALSGCQPSGDETGTVQLRFWNGFSGPDGATMERIVREFNKQHPDIQVKMQIIPWSTYYDKLTLGLAFGDAPDVFVLHAARVPEYAEHNALAPLDDLLKESGLSDSDFVPRAWEAGVWSDARYGLPLDVHPLGMYYNLELFEKAGIVDENGVAKPPRTKEEFLEAARKLTRDTDGDGRPDQWGFAITDVHLVGTTVLFQYGGGILNEETHRSAMTSPQNKAAIDFMLDLINKYRVCPQPGASDAWMGFQTGKIAMAPQGIWMIDSLEKLKGFRYAAAPMPILGPVESVWAGSHNLCMPASLSDRRQKAAWTFMKYLSDNSLEWAKGGQVPVRPHILESAEFQALRVQSQFAKQLPYVRYEPFSLSINQINPFALAAMEAALNQSEPVDQALKTAERRMNQVLMRE